MDKYISVLFQDYLTVTGPGSPAETYTNYQGMKPGKYCLYPGY